MLEQIIKDINLKLNNEYEHDFKVVSEELKNFENSELLKDLEIYYSIKLYILSIKSGKEELDLIVQKGIGLFKEKIDNFIKRLTNDKIKNLELDVLTEIEKIEDFKEFDEDELRTYSFKSDDEILVYLSICGDKEKFRICPYNFSLLYYVNAIINLRLKNYKVARHNFVKALRWNPMDLTALYEMVETYQLEEDNHRFYQEILKAMEITYKRSYLARAYKMLGQYFLNENKLEQALALYGHSTYYNNDKNVIEFMKQLEEKHQIKYKNQNVVLLDVCNEYNIALGGSEKLLSCLVDFYGYLINSEDLDSAYNLLKVIYDLTLDEEIKKNLDNLASIIGEVNE